MSFLWVYQLSTREAYRREKKFRINHVYSDIKIIIVNDHHDIIAASLYVILYPEQKRKSIKRSNKRKSP